MRATSIRGNESMDDIIRLIQMLMDKGHAYQTEDGIYFSIRDLPRPMANSPATIWTTWLPVPAKTGGGNRG